MAQAFIIMQIGNSEMDRVCAQALVPAIKACGLEPKRVDKHNQGGLLKSEIISFIQQSDIMVADLTNERPNCYLEVGYVMGVDKFINLILTAREDHNPSSPSHKQDGPKVHFDLSGYDILFWNPANLDEFRTELEKRIRRRQAMIAPSQSSLVSPWDEEWIEKNRGQALPGFKKSGKRGSMELRFAISDSKPSKTQTELLNAADGAQIKTFGWPIGVMLRNREEYRPRPTTDGIFAEVGPEDKAYDYWALRKNGDFYLLKTLFEDERKPEEIFFNTRIVRITETLLYCARLYSRLGVSTAALINVVIRHGGLKGRVLTTSSPGRNLSQGYSSTEDEVTTETQFPLARVESDLVELVKEFCRPLFMVFDFFELSDEVYEDIVNRFVSGKVT